MEDMNADPHRTINDAVVDIPDAAKGISHLLPRPEASPQQRQAQQEAAGVTESKSAPDNLHLLLGKENRLSRPTLVQGVSEWEFPDGVVDKSTFVSTSLQEGTDASSIEPSSPSPTQQNAVLGPVPRTPRPTRGKRKRYDEKSLENNVIGKRESILFGSPQKRRARSDDDQDAYFEKTIVPKAFEIEFDNRFLDYATAPDGRKMKEKFVWSLEEGKGSQPLSLDVIGARIEIVSDLPKRTKKGLSRVGPMYQARIPEWGDTWDDHETPG